MCWATDAYNPLNEVKEASFTSHPCPHPRLALPSVPNLGPGPGAALGQEQPWARESPGPGAAPADSAGEIAICSSSQTALLGPRDCQKD